MKTSNTAPDTAHRGSPAHRRVLVVESDRLIRGLIVEWLELSGDEAVCVSDPAAAGASAGRYDLVLVDLPAPLPAAHRTVEQLKRSRPATPIVAMSADVTASGRAAHQTLAQELGAAALLVKPFTRKALLAALNRVRT